MKVFGLFISKKIYMPIIIIILAILIEKILKFFIKKTFNPDVKHKKLDSRKIGTIRSLLCNIVRYVIWIVSILWILSVFGINTAAIITGLGVVSLVIGLAFQDILKDVLVGITILFENQYAIGDYVILGDFEGKVISLGLKTTIIKAYTGEVKIISNRKIDEVINYSITNTLAVIDLSVSYESNLNEVEKILKLTALSLKEKVPDLVDDPEILGVQKLDDSSVIFRVVAKCKPAKHFIVERILKKEFKLALDKNKIKIPYPQLEVHNAKWI